MQYRVTNNNSIRDIMNAEMVAYQDNTSQELMEPVGEMLEKVINEGVDAVDPAEFSSIWEAIKSNRHIAIAWLVRKTIENIKNKGSQEHQVVILDNFCDFVLKYFGRRYVAFAFDLLAMAIKNTDKQDHDILPLLAAAAKSSVYCNQEKLKSVASGLVGAYYYNPPGSDQHTAVM